MCGTMVISNITAADTIHTSIKSAIRALADDGELLAKGPYVMEGYLDPPDDVESFDSQGWFHTGDVGHLEDGKFLMIGYETSAFCGFSNKAIPINPSGVVETEAVFKNITPLVGYLINEVCPHFAKNGLLNFEGQA